MIDNYHIANGRVVSNLKFNFTIFHLIGRCLFVFYRFQVERGIKLVASGRGFVASSVNHLYSWKEKFNESARIGPPEQD